MKSASADATPSVAALLGQLRRRAQLLLALRGLWLGAGIGLLGFALLSALVGPTAGWTLASLAWAIVGGLGLLGVHHGLAPARRYQGSAAARLLEKQGLALASAARSAVELAEASDASASPSLIEAHAREVSARLVGLRPSRIVPWSWLRHWSVGAGMLALALGALLLVGVDRARAGAFALLHPAARDAGGLAVADLIGSSHALLTYPAYLGLPPEERIDPIEIEAPVGTSVLFTLRARVSVEAATLRIAGRDHHMVPDEEEEGAFAARFVVRESGPLRISLREPEGAWLVDMSARRIIAREDEAPRVVLLEPREDPTLELHERLVAQIEADDDHGLEGVFLVLRTPDLEQHRHPIPVPNRPRSLRGEASFSPLDYDLRAGDVVGFWAEAVDADSVGGENVGRSEERRLTIASEASGREAGLSSLEALLDACLEALAERLEGPPPEEEGEARARWQRVRAKGEAFVERAHAADEGERMGTDLGLQLAMGERVDALLAQEIRAHGAALASHARRIRADAALVSEFEEDALALADLLGRLRLRDAAGLARELESLRREMASLLAELRRSDSEEARRALRAALGRARLRLDALRERLAAMQTSVPSEFFNAEAARAEAQRAALDALEGALESGDLDAADRSLLDFRREVDALAQALGAANESYGEARFAERDRAMAEALDMLAGLESEERRLAERSEARRREAGVRALESAGMSAGAETARRLAAEAHRTH
ncbi:MAG: hypothetical protein OEY14_05960, partial [Myxococcales bacterium]|nr:hypothetical protein [Myxococcales bacterium]